MSSKFLLLLLLIAALNAQQRTKVIMGTFVHVYDVNITRSESIFSALSACDAVLSSYRSDALIYQLNHQKSVRPNATLLRAFNHAFVFYNESGGAFNVAMGAITRQLMQFEKGATMPSLAQRVNADIDVHSIAIEKERIVIPSTLQVDFGGMGKGFCIDEALHAVLAQSNARFKAPVIVAASGDIACLGECVVDIEQPNNHAHVRKTLASLQGKSVRVSTSGTYRHYISSPKNNHLINPTTRHSATAYQQVTLFSDQNSSALDAYATAANFMPFQSFHRLMVKREIGYLILTAQAVQMMYLPKGLSVTLSMQGFKFASE